MKQKITFLIKNYRETWKYLKECKFYFLFATFVFFLLFLIGFFYPLFFINELAVFFKKLTDSIKDLNALQLIFFILRNNLLSSFIGIISGIFLGIFPVFFAIINGYVLGFVLNKAVNSLGYFQFWRIVPHGIFEIPAVIISFGLGIKLGMFIFDSHLRRELKRRFLLSLKTFIFIILPLLIAAAIIEGILIGLKI